MTGGWEGRRKSRQARAFCVCLLFPSGGFGVMLRYARYRAPDFWIMFPASGFARRYRFSRVLDVAATLRTTPLRRLYLAGGRVPQSHIRARPPASERGARAKIIARADVTAWEKNILWSCFGKERPPARYGKNRAGSAVDSRGARHYIYLYGYTHFRAISERNMIKTSGGFTTNHHTIAHDIRGCQCGRNHHTALCHRLPLPPRATQF